MKGVWTALITPFKKDGSLDLSAYQKLLVQQKKAGVAGVIPCGTTGESPVLSFDEKKTLIQMALHEMAGSKTQVVAGTGSNDTLETIEFSRWASDAGVHGVLVVTPYYNKPSQQGLFQHFWAVAEAVDCPVILYNVPGRTGVSLTTDTIVRLAAHPRICALKEATGNLQFATEILYELEAHRRKLTLLSGDDATYYPFLCVGGHGVISVSSNLIPKEMVALQKAHESGRGKAAQKIHQRYFPIFRDLFVESNPVPIKFAMSSIGIGHPTVRAPLALMGELSTKKLLQSMKACGLRARGKK